mgnify:CR=1 FL=1
MNTISTVVGYSAEDHIADNDKELEVLIPVLDPTYAGPLTPAEALHTMSSVDINDKNQQIPSFVTVNTVTATYLGSPGHTTPPNIHRGERLEVFTFADPHVFYWRVLGGDQSLRTVEHVKIRCSNKPLSSVPLTDETSYYAEMDTRPGSRGVVIKTGHTTGESFSYTIKVDTDNGTINVKDQVGNGFEMVSAWPEGAEPPPEVKLAQVGIMKALDKRIAFERTRAKRAAHKTFTPLPLPREPMFRVYNNYGSFIKMEGKVIDMFTLDAINLSATNTISLKSNVVTRTGLTAINDNTIAYTNKNTSFKNTGSSFISTGSTFTSTASNIAFNGQIILGGPTATTGHHTFQAGTSGDNV